MARTLGVKTGSVKLLLFRARTRLAGLLRRRREGDRVMSRLAECRHEADLVAAVTSGRWPAAVDQALREHVDACAVCAEVRSGRGDDRPSSRRRWPIRGCPRPARCGGARRCVRVTRPRSRRTAGDGGAGRRRGAARWGWSPPSSRGSRRQSRTRPASGLASRSARRSIRACGPGAGPRDGGRPRTAEPSTIRRSRSSYFVRARLCGLRARGTAARRTGHMQHRSPSTQHRT